MRFRQIQNVNPERSFLSHRHSRSQQGARRVGHSASFSLVLHQEISPPAAAVHLPLLVTRTNRFVDLNI